VTVHELTTTMIEEVAVCVDCQRPVRYVESAEAWVHVGAAGADCGTQIEFTGLRLPTAEVGDGLVLVTPQGSWLADVYDIDDHGVHATPV